MRRFFGGRTTAPKPSLDDAVNSTETRISSLDVKISKLNSELSSYQQKLSCMPNGPGKNALKQKALKVLKQKKQLEAQCEQLQSQSWNMQQAQMTTENLKNVMITVDAMKQTNKDLKKQYGKVDIDKIETLQDEMADLLNISSEIQETLSRNYNIPDDISESELDAELEALGEELHYKAEVDTLPPYLEDEQIPNFVDEVPEDTQKVAAI